MTELPKPNAVGSGGTQGRVFVEKISQLCVNHYDKKLYNTNNYGSARPADYTAKSTLCNTSRWMDRVGRPTVRFTIPAPHVKWMRKSNEAARRMGAFPRHMFGDDLDELVEDCGAAFDALIAEMSSRWEADPANDGRPFPGVFIRGETVSLKDGVHGVGPYKTLKPVIESICTASFQHSVLAPSPQDDPAVVPELPLFLFPWVDDLVHALELRVFVHERAVTAISQQHLYNVEPLWQQAPLSHAEAFAQKVVAHFHDVVSKIVDDQSSFTYDLGFRCASKDATTFEQVALKVGIPYFIEPNPFGAEYPAGSSLFDWRYDAARVCNTHGDVFLRFTIADETEVY